MPLKYPIGIQTFSDLRNDGYVYIDKTQYIYQLMQGKYYFLSRPRRFGKSLLLSTLSSIFSGEKDLFQGLWIEDKITWGKYPIIYLDFGKADFKELGLRASIEIKLSKIADESGIVLTANGIGNRFEEIIRELSAEKKVVILIDEYDKPIIEYLGKEQLPQALENRDILKEFYSVIKGLDAHIQFFFLTGVSKFSKVSIFSDLNNLHDITIEPTFSTMLGYTQSELEHYFGERMKELAQQQGVSYQDFLDKVRLWYNGYAWNGKEKVYNPFSILNFMYSGDFRNYWFETGTPTFLVKMMKESFMFNVESIDADEGMLGNFRIEALNETTLLFQTGYLTIKEREGRVYTLGYPNFEVKDSMNQYLMREFAYKDHVNAPILYMHRALKTKDIEKVVEHFNTLFANIPYQIFEEKQESFYHAIIFLAFQLLGYYAQAEVSTSKGRVDAVVQYEDKIFVIEFKVNDSAESAISQIKAKNYHQKYLRQGKEVILLGFACQNKEIADWKMETI
ncbi:ATP-binding protein [Thermoflexibacter ruber]|uniref:PD-(D/E)XK nuclease superfamily protein n=1 Tax=Thermoflexibacter ruber TaxID=1003 RepID=A0A1I2I6M3_9BACT|nr:ATP-binding protein [Thermoflexibacter ruber]SFF37864.1 PD-(D/E)XK nuclease superfamily protein [Thermoflexibacter ruber]